MYVHMEVKHFLPTRFTGIKKLKEGKWDPATGQVSSHAGHPIGDLFKALAVDDAFAYVAMYSNLDDRAKCKFYLARLRIDKTPGSTNWPVAPFTKAGKFVMVYDNGQRDVPIEATVSFWVIPWRLVGAALVVSIFVLIGLLSSFGKISKFTKRLRKGEQKIEKTN